MPPGESKIELADLIINLGDYVIAIQLKGCESDGRKLNEVLSELNEESDSMAYIHKNRVGGKSNTIFMVQYCCNWNYRYT